VDGIINNTHMAEETTVEIVERGADMISEAAKILGIPVIATSAAGEIAEKIGDKDHLGHPVWPLHRYMPKTFW
jgi:hypothetical protein